jgi:cell division protein ZapA (FtsZ GTPase activity inhibitor)
MSKKQTEKTTITINDQPFYLEDMTMEQQAMVNHVQDLDRKMNTSRFNLEQLQFGRDAFMTALTASLQQEPGEESNAEEVQNSSVD